MSGAIYLREADRGVLKYDEGASQKKIVHDSKKLVCLSGFTGKQNSCCEV
jgi:hypothetical protein